MHTKNSNTYDRRCNLETNRLDFYVSLRFYGHL